MIRSSMPKRGNLFTRTAIAAALALGLMAGSAPAMAAKAPKPPKISLSKPFQAAAGPLSQAIEAAKTRADVVAATNNMKTAQAAVNAARGAARTQARANYDASLAALGATLTAEKNQLNTVEPLATTADDRFAFGQLALSLGSVSNDVSLQRRGLTAMIASGKANPVDVPRFNFFAGSLAYDMKDYAAARTSLQAAVDAGFHDNDADALLAEAYMSDNKMAEGLAKLQAAIDWRNTTASKAPVSWYRRWLGAAYKANLLDSASRASLGLVKAYPNSENWAGAITVLREIGKYPGQETLDLMRLMGRTNSFAEERDYIEYIQAADARRLPPEVLKVIEAGTAAGKLRANDMFVTEARTIASGRLAADRATLPVLERDARAASATAATLMGAGDAFLSYGEAAKAEGFYSNALTKAGADTPRVLTRLGIAQFDQGKLAEAQATFARVTGPRQAIAQLWALYAQQKATPAAAPAS